MLRHLIREMLFLESGPEAHILNFYEDLDMPLSELKDAMRTHNPEIRDDELGSRARVRGSEVRASLSSRDENAINRFLPPILNDKERTSVISILYRGLSERVLRSAIRSMIFTG